MYQLSRRILNDEYLAYKSALLFCINPASVYFSAPYAETLFSLATFAALNDQHLLRKGVLFAIASVVRINGMANVVFVVYASMKAVATKSILYVRSKKFKSKEKPKGLEMMTTLTSEALLPGMINVLLTLTPFAAVQWYAYTTFCQDKKSVALYKFPQAVER